MRALSTRHARLGDRLHVIFAVASTPVPIESNWACRPVLSAAAIRCSCRDYDDRSLATAPRAPTPRIIPLTNMRQDDVPLENPFARQCGARTTDAAARVGHRRRRAARAPAKPVLRAGVGPAKVRRRRGRIATWSRRRGPTRVEAVLVASRTTAATCAVRGRRRKLRPEPTCGRRLGAPRRLRRAVFGI